MKSSIGDIFEIRLADGKTAFCQKLKEPEFAFYKSNPIHQPSEKPIFRIWVHKSAIKHWNRLSSGKLDKSLSEEIARFKQDPISGKFSLYKSHIDTPATFEKVQGLEPAAVWEHNHIISRLNDYLAGKENLHVKSLEPKLND